MFTTRLSDGLKALVGLKLRPDRFHEIVVRGRECDHFAGILIIESHVKSTLSAGSAGGTRCHPIQLDSGIFPVIQNLPLESVSLGSCIGLERIVQH